MARWLAVSVLLAMPLVRAAGAVCVSNPVVTTTTATGPGSLSEAIAKACSGSVITFDENLFQSGPTLIGLVGGAGPIFPLGGELTIQGPGPELLALETSGGRCLFAVAEGSSFTLTGVTVRPLTGEVGYGCPGIESSGTLSVENCAFSRCASEPGLVIGGGITVHPIAESTLVKDTEFVLCIGNGLGGGIRCRGGNALIEGCRFDLCMAGPSIFSGGTGGAVGVQGGDTQVTIRRSTLINNIAGSGSAIYITAGDGPVPPYASVEIDSSTIATNTADSSYPTGATVVAEPGTLTVVNSTIAGNIGGATYFGGSLSAPVFDSVTIVDNVGPGPAGLVGFPAPTLKNSVVSGNRIAEGGYLYDQSEYWDIEVNPVSLGHNFIGSVGLTNFSSNTTGDRYGDPLNSTTPNAGATEFATTITALLEPLADNGGPTPTRLPAANSPLVDTGSPNPSFPVDQRGIVRPQGGGVDTGAVERAAADEVAGNDFAQNELQPPGSLTGWGSFGTGSGLSSVDYSTTSTALRAYITSSPDRFRTAGAIGNLGEWLPYSAVGPDRVVRAKYHVFAGGQQDPAELNQLPNLRLRIANRFAVNSMLEVFHQNLFEGDPAQRTRDAELRPSVVPTLPSVYRVDLDPVDVPYLLDNATTEGFAPGFEAYAIYPPDNGFVALAELSLGAYERTAMSSATTLIRAYGGTELHLVNPGELSLLKLAPGDGPGAFGTVETTGPQPTYAEGLGGVTLSTTAIPSDRVGIAARDFNIDASAVINHGARPRVKPGTQYAVRWHLTSTQQVNRQSQIRMRTRSNKFAWSAKLEIGGAWATNAASMYPLNANNSIAQQALPGVGTQNPDKSPGDTAGGWYTLVMHTPLSPDIRPEFEPSAPLSLRMPALSSQPGPGENLFSRRDLFVGIDLVDSLSGGLGAPLEAGQVTLDQVEIYEFPKVAD